MTISLFFCASAFASAISADSRSSVTAEMENNDVDIVKSRLLAAVLSGSDGDSGASIRPSDAAEYAASLRPDGSWPDVNYTDRTRTGAWSPEKHLRRQLTMAIVSRQNNDTKLIAAVHLALAFWLAHSAPNGTTYPYGEIHSSNWFCGEIWSPAMLSSTALAFEPWLTANETQVNLSCAKQKIMSHS